MGLEGGGLVGVLSRLCTTRRVLEGFWKGPGTVLEVSKCSDVVFIKCQNGSYVEPHSYIIDAREKLE